MNLRSVRGGCFALLLVPAVALGQAAQPEATAPPAAEDLTAQIASKEAELATLAAKIRALEASQTQQLRQQARLTSSVELLEERVRHTRLELDRTTLSIEEVRLRIREAGVELERLGRMQERLRSELTDLLRLLSLLDQRSPLEILIGERSLSDFFGARAAVERIQARATALLTDVRSTRQVIEARELDLRRRQRELEQLAQLQTVQRAALKQEEERKRLALSRTVEEAARVASLLAEAEEARREVQAEIFVLNNVGIRLSLKEAEDFARFAGRATGIRPALLLAVLKVESNVGGNVGSGRYPEDVHPDHREAFLRVVSKLGLDPAATPVSAKPTTYAGWGGALGPGQILPGTWEAVEPDVARITGKERPSPFELLDAFVATAVILRNAGAASGSEFEAANRYFAGPSWQRFTWYGDRVLAVAKEYES